MLAMGGGRSPGGKAEEEEWGSVKKVGKAVIESCCLISARVGHPGLIRTQEQCEPWVGGRSPGGKAEEEEWGVVRKKRSVTQSSKAAV